MPVEPARRAVLVASAAALPLLLAGCRGVQALGAPPPPPPDIRVLRSAIAAEQLLLARYTAALAEPAGPSTPGQASAVSQNVIAALRAVRAEHAAHLTQLRARLLPAPGKPGPTPSPTASAGRVTLPSGASAVLAALEQDEQAASDRLIGQLAGLPPSLAQLFASIAASEATHVPFLRSAGMG